MRAARDVVADADRAFRDQPGERRAHAGIGHGLSRQRGTGVGGVERFLIVGGDDGNSGRSRARYGDPQIAAVRATMPDKHNLFHYNTR